MKSEVRSMAYLQVMYTYVTTSQVVHAPATSLIIKLLSKAARIGKLNAATFVVRPEAVAVIADRHAMSTRGPHVIPFQRVIKIIFTPFACEKPACCTLHKRVSSHALPAT